MGGKRLSSNELWIRYTDGKQTLQQLSAQEGVSVRTIQRYLSRVKIERQPAAAREVVLLMDTSYWGRTLGVMLFKDAISGDNLHWQFVKYETNKLYYQGYLHLLSLGFRIGAIVCDGRKGLVKVFDGIPVQMCLFHQIAIITRYLTRNPKLLASRELKELAATLTKTDKVSFETALLNWHKKWANFLAERTVDQQTGRSFYTHKRLRSAYRSLVSNLPWLFTWEQNPHMNITKTTNMIDGCFADLKNKLRCHNGLSESNKRKFVDGFLEAYRPLNMDKRGTI